MLPSSAARVNSFRSLMSIHRSYICGARRGAAPALLHSCGDPAALRGSNSQILVYTGLAADKRRDFGQKPSPLPVNIDKGAASRRRGAIGVDIYRANVIVREQLHGQ